MYSKIGAFENYRFQRGWGLRKDIGEKFIQYHVGEEFIIAVSSTGAYITKDVAISVCLAVIPVSKPEYLIRDLSELNYTASTLPRTLSP